MRFAFVFGVVAAMAAASAGHADELADGKAVFLTKAAPSCAICHTLSDAGANGMIGPVLDDLKPDEARVKKAVTQGVGVMPAYGESLSAADIDAVAAYVATAVGTK
ncbi:c-type cytochrome [Acuticoccus kandeliae]|uniref:SorU family sulfite dehydrogenase c-type cytochrome subunit n=1 Tax=Acuticoccus kandeliae TaxID=2073160 RepID=UPI000D3E20B9|nr:cytochrome c [Acuticoccus kandeliae]